MKFAILSALAMTVPLAAQAQTAPAAPAATPAPAQGAAPAVGATVLDPQGGVVGTIDQITPQAIVINTGTNKVGVPPTAIGTSPKGPTVSMTKAELDAAYAQQQGQAQAEFKSKLVAGTMVHGLNGSMLGTIKAADAQFVTVTTKKGDVKLPVNGFGPGEGNSVRLGMTAEQLDAAMGGAATQPKPAAN